jgi:hypothetical protein
MKARILRPWHLGIVLLAALPVSSLLRARGQSPPPPLAPPVEVPAPSPAAVTPLGDPELGTIRPPTLVRESPFSTSPQPTRAAKPRTTAKPLQTAGTLPAQAAPSGAYYADKLAKIIIPSVQFREASVDEAIEMLRSNSRDYDTMEKDPARKGVNFILKHDATTSTAKVTLDLKEVPMAEVLKYLTQLAGMAYRIEPFAVVVMPLTEWKTQMFTRNFRVPPDFLTANATLENPTAMDILTAHSIQFPEGASATFFPSSSSLVVRNTEPELNQVEMLLNSIVQASPASQTSDTTGNHRVNQANVLTVPGMAAQVSSPLPAATLKPTQIVAVEGGRLRVVEPGGNIFLEADGLSTGGPASNNSRLAKSTRAEQILRDAELRVLMRHFEAAVSEITEGEKALLLEGDAAKQSALEARIKALRDWKARLVNNINGLTGSAAIVGELLDYGASYTAEDRKPAPANVLSVSKAAAQKQRAQALAAEQDAKARERMARPNSFGDPANPRSTPPAATPRARAGGAPAPGIPGIGVESPAAKPPATPPDTSASGGTVLEELPILGRLFERAPVPPPAAAPGAPPVNNVPATSSPPSVR